MAWDFEEWHAKAGPNKPRWMSDFRWAQENAKYQQDLWNRSSSAWLASLTGGWEQGLDELKTWASTNMPTYNPTQWSDYQGRYSGYQNSLDNLLAQIQAGPTAADDQEALNKMLADYGLTPEQWAQIQGSTMTSAEDVQKRAQTMAFDPNSEANKNFEAMIMSQQRAAEAGIGKQLESIFADRGGLGGFAAAQDYTLQMSDQLLKTRSDFMVSQMQDAIEMVNQDIGRKMTILQAGVDDKRAYLDQRWSQLQQAFQNTAYMADQVMKEFTMTHDANAQDFAANVSAFTMQFNSMKDILITNMGIDQAAMDYMSSWYDMNIKPWLEQMALELSGGQ